MTGLLVFLVALCLLVGVLAWPHLVTVKIRNTPFPSAWQNILQRSFPPYRHLPETLRARLHQSMQYFLHDKTFVGCAGQTLTDEIRVLVAAQACLLVLNRSGAPYPGVRYIHIYPSAFVAEHQWQSDDGVVSTYRDVLLGEAWDSGKVILSWDDALRGVRDFEDGNNLVLHEFAHHLDAESGVINGAPRLGNQAGYRSWAETLSKEFEALREDARSGRESLFDEYGATSPEEFFAVATETFLEKPRAMRREHPRLYAELERYYGLDPTEWVRPDAERRP